MKLYGIPNCNTVKKARAWLNAHGVAYEFHDFRKHGVSQPLINGWLTQVPWEKLVNRAGMTWRALPEAEKSMVQDNASATALMLAKPSIIKRPVLTNGTRIIQLGFDADNYASLTHDASSR